MYWYNVYEGLQLSDWALASGAVGSEFEPREHGCFGRQTSLIIALYSVYSSNVFLLLEDDQKLYKACVHCK